MKQKKIFLYLFFFLISEVFTSRSSYPVYIEKTIATPHFLINYNINDTNSASSIAVELESCLNTISAFLDVDPLDRIHVIITGENNVEVSADELNSTYKTIYISSRADFNYTKSEIYRKVFIICLSGLIHNHNLSLLPGESFINALIHYPAINSQIKDTMINDLVNVEKIYPIDLDEIKKFNKDQQLSIYTAFIDFIISGYSKKILIQAFKDSGYYNGIFESISKITGDSILNISQNFNTWLIKHKTDNRVEFNNHTNIISDDTDFKDCSFSISEDNKSALLQNKNNEFRIFITNDKNREIIDIKKSDNQSRFSEIVFINNDQLAVIENIQSGSKIFIYDIKQKKFYQKGFLPYLFIDDSDSFNSESLIFSAWCGAKRDIYVFNFKTSDFDILTDSGNNYSPVKMDEKVYFISIKDKESIVELDNSSGKARVIFSTESKISSLSKTDDKTITFSMNINNRDTVYLLNVKTGSLKKININTLSLMQPVINRDRAYYFSFYKSRYQIVSSDYNAEGI